MKPTQNKREKDWESLGKDKNNGNESSTSEKTSVDTSETIEDENQYDHMGDDKFIVDASPTFTAGSGETSCPTCQKCGFNTQCNCGSPKNQEVY